MCIRDRAQALDQVLEEIGTKIDRVIHIEVDEEELITRLTGRRVCRECAATYHIKFNPPKVRNVCDQCGGEPVSYTHLDVYKRQAEYLGEKYKELVGMDNPQLNIHGGDYSIFSGEDVAIYGTEQAQSYSVEFYNGSGDITGQILNYNFNRVAFYGDDEGKLFLARVFQPDLSGVVGDYPIITAGEAKELLKKGNYITTVPEALPGLAYAAKVELIYRAGGTEQYFMPYYRFYAELPDMERENGLKTYGAYYVPAVKGEYISNMPVWEGTFN